MGITFEQYKLIYDLLEEKMDEIRPLTYSDEIAYELHLDYVFTQVAVETEMKRIKKKEGDWNYKKNSL